MRLRLLPLLLAGAALASKGASLMAVPNGENLVVIVNASSTVSKLSPEEVTNIFMGRQKRLAPGVVALPVESVGDAQLRSRFYRLLMDAPLPQIRSYWARMYFSGQGQPPRQAEDSNEVLEIVSHNQGAIGFVEQSKVDKRVKTVLVIRDAEPR